MEEIKNLKLISKKKFFIHFSSFLFSNNSSNVFRIFSSVSGISFEIIYHIIVKSTLKYLCAVIILNLIISD